MQRIKENKERLEALGLSAMVYSSMSSVKKTKKSLPKGKEKIVEEDEKYRPLEGDDGLSSSSEEDACNEEIGCGRYSRSLINKVHCFFPLTFISRLTLSECF